MSQNHYHVLGVSPAAPAAEIKQAFKRLAVRFHPDKHGGSTQFEEQFKAVNAAYHVLGDPGRRATYDHQLQLEARRAAEARRQQQYRPQNQHVYGVPMPPPAPLRTRPPAGSAERHYQRRSPRRGRFTRRDYLLVAGVLGLVLLLGLGAKALVERLTAASNYQSGLQAYGRREWSAAHSLLSEAIRFRPDFGPARRRRAEIEQLVYRRYAPARSDYYAALAAPAGPAETARLLYRLGQCQAALHQPDSAELNLSRALALDSTLTGAWLARGRLRLFELRVFPAAVQDFSTGLRQLRATGRPRPAQYLTLRGLASYKQREFGAARADYRQVLADNPANGQIHFLLGCLAEQEGRPADACEFFRRARALGYRYQVAEKLRACR